VNALGKIAFKTISIIAGFISIAAGVAVTWADKKELDLTIAEKIAEAFANRK